MAFSQAFRRMVFPMDMRHIKGTSLMRTQFMPFATGDKAESA